MSKTKLLILSLMVIKPICSTNDYTKLIKVGDTVETYVKRMKNRDLPNLGESYEEFTKNCKNSDFTLDEYEKLMDSFPIIYELLDSFARRKQGSITYEDENLNYLIEYYPEVYESYSEYIKRIENKEDSRKSKSVRKSSNSSENSAKTEFILTHDMFRNLKRIFPNIGESYENYILRIKQYGIKGLSLDYFSSFITLIPKRHESLTSYLSRFKVGHAFIIMNNWKIPRKVDTYIGLKRLIPRLGESYLEYEKRMTEIDLSSMQLDIFNTFQKLYPQLNEEFRQYSFRNNSFDYSKIIYLDELQQVEFTLLKRRLPILFENFDAYKSRIMEYDNDNDSTIVYEEFYNARRMYPKLSESYNEYSKRLSDLSLEIWSENFFLEFKMNYPQIDYSYEDLHKNTNAPMLGLTYAEYGNHVQLDRNKFEILKTKTPVPFRVYQYYKYKMFLQNIQPLEEDDHEDFKKVFIKQCETYADYCSRMESYGIQPMTKGSVVLFKQTIPRNWEEDFQEYEIIGNYFNLSNMKAYDEIEFTVFKNIAPYAHEKYVTYSTYTSRVKNSVIKCKIQLNDKEFSDLISKYPKINETRVKYVERLISFCRIPLSEEEFSDLKSKYPKINETYDDYVERLISFLLKPDMTNDDFKHFKQVQVQIEDDYENYSTRINNFVEADLHHWSKEDFDLFKSRIPLLFEDNYSSYLKAHAPKIFNEDDYNDYFSVYPQYYITFDEYLHIMDDTALIPLSKDGFQKFKLSYPNIYEINYEEYQEKLEKLNLPKMTKTQFYLFKWKTPKPFEGPKTFENRMKNLYPATQNLTELYSLYIRIFPQLSNSYEEYRQYMGLMCIKPMDINYFKSYKNYFPEHDENDYPKYQNRLNILGTQNKDTSESNFLLMEEFSMKENEFKTFKSRLPSVHERYKNYELRNQDIGPLCEFEFNDLKYQYSVSYENYIEHEQRMTDSFRKPLSLGVFSEEKSMRVLLGENYSEHFKKITQKYESYIGKLNDSKQIIEHMKYLGIETLDVDNFIEHKLAYPYNYGTFEKFCSLMISHNWKGTPAITEIWFTRMKILRPKLCDKFDDYNNRTRIYGFPEMTEIQFQRTKYEHSTPGESTHDFLQRLNINDKIKPYIKEIHLNFTLLSPRYFENYPAYLDRVRQYEELMDFSEFKCFMEYLPKLGEDLFTFNNRNKPSNFNELNSKSFVALKLFFPRIYHYTYNDYLLDIAINHSDMNVMDSLKVNPDEFMKYKSKFPRQFELYYDAYYDRIIKEGITEIFNKEDFQSFKAANFPLPHEDYNQHRANMKSIGFNSLPKDVFYFFKGLYPNLFATTYLYRSSEIVTQLLNPTNFDDPIYKENMTKPIVKEIIERFDSYQEMENKYENLTLHFMTNNQFEEFTMCFPKLFESYNSYKLSMLETTYFPPIDETYDQYLKRMKQLQNNQYLNAKEFEEFTLYFSFGVVSSDEFHYKLLMKKQLNYREPYLPFVYAYFPMVYENYNMYRERLRHLDHKCLDKEQYNAFVMDFPDTPLFYSAYKHDSECTVYFTLIDKNYKEYEARMAKKSINDILSENDYEEKKKNYFSSIYEKEYDHYVQRIKNLVHRAMLSRDFQNFQSIEFPRVFKQYDEFQMNVLEKGATKVMNEETYILLTNAFFPPIYEDSENYHKRMTILKNHVMSNEEFQEFTINFPLISKSYYAYKSCLQRADRPQKARIGVISFNDGALKIIDETLFNSIKNAYFPKMNETYETYSKRMISIGFNPLAKKQFQDCIDVYPKPSPHFSTYIKNPETTNRTEKSSSIMNYIDTGMKNIGCVPLSYRAFDNFRQTIPRISQSYNDYYKNVIDKGFILMLNKNQSEAVKDVFYPRMTEDYNEYNNRLNILGMNIIKEEDYKLYKQTYPKFFENTYETYLKRFSQESPHLNEEEFNNFLKNSPRLVENYDMYLKRRRKEMLYTNHVIEEHSYQMYYELKYVFMPDQCETLDTYIMKIKSLSLNENRENIMNYYMEIMELYPRFFESYEDYLQRINESMKLIHLKLNETEFHLYFSSYPRPFESYHIYVHRMRDQEYVLTKNQFNNYRKIYSRIPENIESYVARLETLGYKNYGFSETMIKYFKYIYPLPDEIYKEYSDRIDSLDFQSDIFKRQQFEFLINVLKITKMTKKEFKSFKLSLPKPHENYENYMIRIELLKMNGFKGIQYIFPEDLFDDIKMSYPKADEFISVYKTRLISYDYECYVKNVAQFIQDFEEVITKSLEHMFFNYL